MKRLLAFSIASLLAAIGSGAAQTSNPQAVSCTELTAWVVGGISTSRLNQLVSERGLAFTLSPANEKQLRAAGAEAPLLKALRNMHAVNVGDGKGCPAALTKAAESAKQKHYEDAEKQLRELLHSQPEDANLRFAMGEILRDQDTKTRKNSPEMIANLHAIKQIGYESRDVLEAGKLDEFGHLLHEHWERKRRRSRNL